MIAPHRNFKRSLESIYELTEQEAHLYISNISSTIASSFEEQAFDMESTANISNPMLESLEEQAFFKAIQYREKNEENEY